MVLNNSKVHMRNPLVSVLISTVLSGTSHPAMWPIQHHVWNCTCGLQLYCTHSFSLYYVYICKKIWFRISKWGAVVWVSGDQDSMYLRVFEVLLLNCIFSGSSSVYFIVMWGGLVISILPSIPFPFPTDFIRTVFNHFNQCDGCLPVSPSVRGFTTGWSGFSSLGSGFHLDAGCQ